MQREVTQVLDQLRLDVEKHAYVSEEPWAIFLSGGAGSGKGTVLRHLVDNCLLPPSLPVLDVDAVRTRFKAWKDAEKKKMELAKKESRLVLGKPDSLSGTQEDVSSLSHSVDEGRKAMEDARVITQA